MSRCRRNPPDTVERQSGSRGATDDARLFDQWFVAMDSAADHTFGFNEAVSYSVECEDQAEVDRYWSALTADERAESMCGWLKDKFGLSSQIVPKRLNEQAKRNIERFPDDFMFQLTVKELNCAIT